MSTTEHTYYGLRLPSGELARLSRTANCGDCCGEYTWTLVDDRDCPEWLVADPEAVANTLFADTPWYNTDQDRPGWGRFEREDLTPAKVTVTTLIAPAPEVRVPINVGCRETRRVPWAVARRYTGRPDLPQHDYTLVVASTPLPELLGRAGTVLCFGSVYNRRRLVAALPVPEEYADLPGANSLLICEEP